MSFLSPGVLTIGQTKKSQQTHASFTATAAVWMRDVSSERGAVDVATYQP